jgi:hypothetical protein
MGSLHQELQAWGNFAVIHLDLLATVSTEHFCGWVLPTRLAANGNIT